MAKETRGRDQAPETQEGPRSFGVFLQKLADGAAEAELSRELHDLTKAIKEEVRTSSKKVKGTLTLKLDIEAEEEKGMVMVTFDVTKKAPKPLRRKGYQWFTAGGNLQSEAPKQVGLPFQEVANSRGIPNDLPIDDEQPAREA